MTSQPNNHYIHDATVTSHDYFTCNVIILATIDHQWRLRSRRWRNNRTHETTVRLRHTRLVASTGASPLQKGVPQFPSTSPPPPGLLVATLPPAVITVRRVLARFLRGSSSPSAAAVVGYLDLLFLLTAGVRLVLSFGVFSTSIVFRFLVCLGLGGGLKGSGKNKLQITIVRRSDDKRHKNERYI